MLGLLFLQSISKQLMKELSFIYSSSEINFTTIAGPKRKIMSVKTFQCQKCGACCQQLQLFGKAYAFLDDGTGGCRYYDYRTHLCTIYSMRPLICRVQEGYQYYFLSIPYQLYIEQTVQCCIKLQRMLKQKSNK